MSRDINKERDSFTEESLLSLLGYPDSNQERQDQNLQCYHYTIAQTSRAHVEEIIAPCGSFPFASAKVRPFCEKTKHFREKNTKKAPFAL